MADNTQNVSFYTGNIPEAFQGEVESMDVDQQLEVLRNSYIMYERSKAEMVDVRSKKKDKYGNRIYSDKSIKKTLALMDNMQNDIKIKYLQLGGKEEDLPKEVGKIDRREIKKAIRRAEQQDGNRLYDMESRGEDTREIKKEEKPFETEYQKRKNLEINTSIENYKVPSALLEENDKKKNDTTSQEFKKYNVSPILVEDTVSKKTEIKNNTTNKKMEEYNENRKNMRANVESDERDGISVRGYDGKAAYDTINLPSKGECYKDKNKTVEVSYLTAYDENLILSPNLYRSGTFLDHMLKNKVHGVDPDDLVQGDRDAIIIWLRASGYGNQYPVSVTDNETGEDFDTVVDLTKLKYRKFELIGDENGFFDFTLPVTGDEVKFKFLTNRDTKKLQQMREDEDKEYKATTFKNSLQKLSNIIEGNGLFDDDVQEKLLDAVDTLKENGLSVLEKMPKLEYSHDMTNHLILSTVSINGNTDRKFIVDYILNLNIRDAREYRDYILNNSPGIDYNVKVQRPESLGGGYIDTFLRLDQFIFIPKI